MRKIFLTFIIIGAVYMNVFSQVTKYCRFEKDGEIHYGKELSGKVYELKHAPWISYEMTGRNYDLEEVKLLYPSEPKVIAGLIKSYKQSWKDKTAPKTIRWFLKPPLAAGIPGSPIVLPASLDEIKVEVEMVIVIGKQVKDADEAEAGKAIFGYTLGCDIVGTTESYHKLNNEPPDPSETALSLGLKACDGFEPYGPFIYKGVDWQNRKAVLKITNDSGTFVNYEDNTSNLMYKPEIIVSELSKVMTLSPGDIISSGTGKSFIAKPGDEVYLSIEGLGEFTTKIEKN